MNYWTAETIAAMAADMDRGWEILSQRVWSATAKKWVLVK